MHVALNDFLQNDKGSSDGKAVTITKSGSSWADQMDYGMRVLRFYGFFVENSAACLRLFYFSDGMIDQIS